MRTLAGGARDTHHAPSAHGTDTRRKASRSETACVLNRRWWDCSSVNRVNANHHLRVHVAKPRGCEGALAGRSRSDRRRQRAEGSERGWLEPSGHISVRAETGGQGRSDTNGALFGVQRVHRSSIVRSGWQKRRKPPSPASARDPHERVTRPDRLCGARPSPRRRNGTAGAHTKTTRWSDVTRLHEVRRL